MVDDFVTPVRPLDLETPPFVGEKLSETPRSLREVSAEDNSNKYFKGQQKNEEMLCFTRKHWIVLIPHFLGFSFFLAVIIGYLFFVPESFIDSIFGAVAYKAVATSAIGILTVYLHRFFIRIFNFYLNISIITNFRVLQLDQTLYLIRNRDSIDLPEIQDIVIEQKGIVKTIFNYGEIIITLSSAHASKTLSCIPNPEYYFRKINKTKREYITSRRMEKGMGPSAGV